MYGNYSYKHATNSVMVDLIEPNQSQKTGVNQTSTKLKIMVVVGQVFKENKLHHIPVPGFVYY
jgi:hypothetical protein